MHRKLRLVVPAVTALVVVLTLAVSLLGVSTPAQADTRYSAGNLTPGTQICNCPVTVGNCVCAYTDPQPQPPREEEAN
jgi:hypothetical protein